MRIVVSCRVEFDCVELNSVGVDGGVDVLVCLARFFLLFVFLCGLCCVVFCYVEVRCVVVVAALWCVVASCAVVVFVYLLWCGVVLCWVALCPVVLCCIALR